MCLLCSGLTEYSSPFLKIFSSSKQGYYRKLKPQKKLNFDLNFKVLSKTQVNLKLYRNILNK